MQSKLFVLDTNVLLHDPEAITKFPGMKLSSPVTVLEELDKMKRFPNELGKNSRAVFRFLDSLHNIGEGNLHHGVKSRMGRPFASNSKSKPTTIAFTLAINDNRIIMAASFFMKKGSTSFLSPKTLPPESKLKRSALKRKIMKI